MFPWQSGSEGIEERPSASTSTRPGGPGGARPDLSHNQRHVNAANLRSTYLEGTSNQATHDYAFLENYGAEMMPGDRAVLGVYRSLQPRTGAL